MWESTLWQQIHHATTPAPLPPPLWNASKHQPSGPDRIFFPLAHLSRQLLVFSPCVTVASNAMTSLSDSRPVPKRHGQIWWLGVTVAYLRHQIHWCRGLNCFYDFKPGFAVITLTVILSCGTERHVLTLFPICPFTWWRSWVAHVWSVWLWSESTLRAERVKTNRKLLLLSARLGFKLFLSHSLDCSEVWMWTVHVDKLQWSNDAELLLTKKERGTR